MRLLSLDVFRGITIMLMILVGNPGSWDYVYTNLEHAEWNGCTIADLVFPFFLFIVGVAITYSLSNKTDRGYKKKQLILLIIRRTVILFVLGLFLNNFTQFDLATLRIMGVLQRIALCYFFASLIFLYFNSRGQLFFMTLLLFSYQIFMTVIPVPGYGAGVLEKEGNLVQYIDHLVLEGHMREKNWEPEGLLSTIPAIATTLLGVSTGQYIRSKRFPLEKVTKLFFFGILFISAGLLWNILFPINKNLWTSSYVVFTGGMAFLFFATCYYLFDIRKYMGLAKPFIILGMNAIIVYVSSEIISKILEHTHITFLDGAKISVKTFLYETFFVSWAGQLNGSLFYALTYLILWLGIMTIFYERKIFIKI